MEVSLRDNTKMVQSEICESQKKSHKSFGFKQIIGRPATKLTKPSEIKLIDGGVHTKVFFTTEFGYIIALDEQKRKDEQKELTAKFYINSLNRLKKLKNYSASNQIISTQNRITDNDLLEDHQLALFVEQNPTLKTSIYKFELYNNEGFEYQELHDYIKKIREDKNLDIANKTEIAQHIVHPKVKTIF